VKHDEFIGHVQQRARLDSRGAAEQATRAVLETLGERLGGGEPSDLAAQLPPEIGRHLEQHENGSERYDLNAFYERVAERQNPGADVPQAAHHARAVLSVVRDAVSEGLADDLRQQLPEEYTEIVDWDDPTDQPGA
jgi:uncharacterized protein (DUF2267 family)